jgi:signal peptidase I
VGLPGDTIQVKAGLLHINGVPVKRRQVEDFRPDDGNRRPAAMFIETLPEGREHRILEYSDGYPSDNTPIYTVPAGHYFAMGDNRDNSRDSRFPEVGPIPAENLVGRAEILFFSTDGSAGWLEPWKWPFAVRYGRLLDGIV